MIGSVQVQLCMAMVHIQSRYCGRQACAKASGSKMRTGCLPKAIGRKFKRTNILMILRTDPSVIESMHPSSLEAMRTTGLTLTERRAIHEHLKFVAPKWKAMTSDKMCERKWMWHASLQSKLKEMLKNPSNVDDYSGDYGYPDTPVYEQQTVAKSNLLSMEELERRRAEEA